MQPQRTTILLLASMTIALAFESSAQHVSVSTGTIQRFEQFPSSFVHARTVDVWLPATYDTAGRCAVLYMQDGQMLFDSTTTWNHQEWMVDEVVTRLLAADSIADCIVVGVWNTGMDRHAEYFPQGALSYLPAELKDSLIRYDLRGNPQADKYLLFLTRELKPFIDTRFATSPVRQNTFIAGSSMGGLISLYALCEYPDVFGGAACLSTHWPGSLLRSDGVIPRAFNTYVSDHLAPPETHRIYFDYGTRTLDTLYKPYQEVIDSTVRSKGYTPENWMTREFTGADHTERSWAQRLAIPLIFLLGKH